MKLLCPICRQPLNANYVCEVGHSYEGSEGVLKLMRPNFERQLSTWLRDYESFRASQSFDLNFQGLPRSGISVDPYTWKARTLDWKIIQSLVQANWQNALDIGSWNGWLAHRLTQCDLSVIAVDYFIDEKDGLKAKKHYPKTIWHAIQMDLEDLSLLQDRFDLIVVNRCFPYFSDASKMITTLKTRLAPQGSIVITGLNLSRKELFLNALEKSANSFEAAFRQPFKFKDFKGYIDQEDLDFLESESFKLILYPNFRNRLKRWMGREFGLSFYAHFEGK